MGYKIPIFINQQDISKAVEILKKSGFYDFVLQEVKEDQIIGLVREANYLDWLIHGYGTKKAKEMSECQVHVRLFNDGRIESELEISRFDLRHLYGPRVSHHFMIELILAFNGIHYNKGSPGGPLDPVKTLEQFPKQEKIDWMTKLIEFIINSNQSNQQNE